MGISFLAIGLFASGILLAAWWLLRSEKPPRWLGYLLLGAVALRLAAGVLWFVIAPIWGHDSPAEQAGYIMADASKRDRIAWKLAHSDKPLRCAFGAEGCPNYRSVDQYGGLLFISAAIYRYMGGPTHQPLLIVVLTATFSSLAILFTWALARRAWDEQVALLAAWLLALYPEAILLGSTQMREAFTITLTTMTFYGLLEYQQRRSAGQERSWHSLGWVFIPLLLYLPFSPPFTALLIGMLALAALALMGGSVSDLLRQRWFWLALAILVVLGLFGSWLALNQLAPRQMSNPVELLSWWLRKSADFQAHLSKTASGWLQKIFKSTPSWAHLPILVAYGVMQPFLPAAMIVGSQAPMWPPIVLWRSLGWTLMLTMLIYAPTLAVRRKDASDFTRIAALIVWIGILLVAFRSGGDMWDNPRYRAAFAGLQVSLAAWAWIQQRRVPDPWLRRALISLGAVLVWFLPWYLDRYSQFTWPVADLFKTVGLGLATAFLLVFGDWIRGFTAQPPAPHIASSGSDNDQNKALDSPLGGTSPRSE